MSALSAISGAAGASATQSALKRESRKARRLLDEGLEAATPFRQLAEAQFDPFATEDPGAALNLLRAFSGAGGQLAQRRAFEGFEDSPGVAFLRERGLRGINRGAAAGGNLGSGRRLEALTQFSQGLALQDLQRQLGLLAGVESREIGLAGQRAGRADIRAQDIFNIQQGKSDVVKQFGSGIAQAAGARAGAFGNIITGGISDVFGIAGGLSNFFQPGVSTPPTGDPLTQSIQSQTQLGPINFGFG